MVSTSPLPTLTATLSITLPGIESSGTNGRGVNNFPGFEYLNYGDSDYDARHRSGHLI